MLNNEKGFSLAQVMIAAGLLGGLSLIFMQLMKNMGQAQNFAQSKSDEIELKSSMRMILNDEKFCRVSLAGNGPSGSPSSPIVFKKKNIDENDEGLDIALYLSNQAGDARTLKKFNGENNPGTNDKSKFGRLKIKTLKLIMNNGIGSNYSDSLIHTDVGVLRAVVEKKVSTTQTRKIKMDFDLNLVMSTGQSPENHGETRIISCNWGPASLPTSFTTKTVTETGQDFWTPGSNSRIVTPNDTFTKTATCPDVPGKTFQFRTCEGYCNFYSCQNPPSFCSKRYNGIISYIGSLKFPTAGGFYTSPNSEKECKVICSSGSSLAVYGNIVGVYARCYYK
ncbi:MAG: hypothetical protein QF441_12665 [Bacteriovoracaceae bacterium]|jgi:hypothetical protein|nr:hypothetical protein [Halobacteriovoraceae bacterium]MDP7321457.1 hypothetical protein [Bacteriovoracaceae bacterium]